MPDSDNVPPESRVVALLCLLASLVLQGFALTLSKLAALRMDRLHVGEFAKNYEYWLSLACLGLQAVFWAQVLRRFPLLWAYLLATINYATILVVSRVIFGESVSHWNMVGTSLIVCGVIVVISDSRAAIDG